MAKRINIDEYTHWLPRLGTPEIEEAHLPAQFIEKLKRVRGMYDYWLTFPNKVMNDMVMYDMDMFGVQKTQAYQDVGLVKLLLGFQETSTKAFWRWSINNIILDNIKAARREKDFRSVASLTKNLILNNQTDKEDPIDIDFEQIVPQQFEMTDNITTINPTKTKISRKKLNELIVKYSGTSDMKIDDAEFEEINKEEDGE